MKKICIKALACSCLMMPLLLPAQQFENGREFFKNAGADFDNASIQAFELAPGIHAFRGLGGNIVASIGAQGVLLVDDQFPELLPGVRETIANLGGGDVDFVINTHWHFDHADANEALANSGSWILAHENSRAMMQQDNLINLVSARVKQAPYSAEALPVMTFKDRMRLHFNGQTIELLHFGPAHTAGDVAVLFRESGVVHMGDVYNGRYPFIDAGNGGSLEGVILFCQKVLAELGDEAVVVPGHGQPGDKAAFKEYIEMLETIHDRLSLLIEEGATLEKVLASGITAEWDQQNGDPTRLLDRAYHSMIH